MARASDVANRPRSAAGILFAVPIEADAFERLAQDHVEMEAGRLRFHEGVVGGRHVAWCVTGPGAAAASHAARLLIDGHRPRLLVSAGFAGGLAASIPRGSVVQPARVIDAMGGSPLPLAHADAANLTIVTVDRIVTTAAAKRSLAADTAAQLVDMETHAVAVVAADAGLPCAAIRVVSDDASQDLPAEVARLIVPQSPLRRLGAAFGAVGRRPGAALDLWKLYEHAVVDGRTLATELGRFCGSLPAAHD
jgi:adenosylhomocysteine nucleosidase